MLDDELCGLFGRGKLWQRDEVAHHAEPVDYCQDDSVTVRGRYYGPLRYVTRVDVGWIEAGRVPQDVLY